MSEFPELQPGLVGRAVLVVGAEHTATHFGSGQAEVFATPMMIALMEAAAVDAVEDRLPAGFISLGTHLDVSHIAATPQGARVEANAKLAAVSGRTLTFAVEARDAHEIVGRGTHTRVIVDQARFAAKLAGKPAAAR